MLFFCAFLLYFGFGGDVGACFDVYLGLKGLLHSVVGAGDRKSKA